MDKDQTNALVFATVSVPISDWWGGSHAIKRKRLAVQTAENDLRDNAELLLINMQSKWNDVENAYEQLKIDRETIDQSEENLRLQRDQYDAGQSTMSDLLTAALSLQNAQSSYISDYTDYQLKLLEYRQAIGQTTK
ncbi:MAG: TolC family protein, partial [Prevotella sp.]|nr:TolC family protein [Prevotella sp.]